MYQRGREYTSGGEDGMIQMGQYTNGLAPPAGLGIRFRDSPLLVWFCRRRPLAAFELRRSGSRRKL